MEMPDVIYAWFNDHNGEVYSEQPIPNTDKYHHDRILKAKDARIAELETFIEKNGLELP